MKLTDPKFVKAVETVADLRGVSSVAGILEIAQWLADEPTEAVEDRFEIVQTLLRVGDVVKTVSQDEWNGLRCRVTRVGAGNSLRLKPLQYRPCVGRGEFLWHADNVEREYSDTEW